MLVYGEKEVAGLKWQAIAAVWKALSKAILFEDLVTVVFSGVPSVEILISNVIESAVLALMISGEGSKQPGSMDAAWMYDVGFSMGGYWGDCVQPGNRIIGI